MGQKSAADQRAYLGNRLLVASARQRSIRENLGDTRFWDGVVAALEEFCTDNDWDIEELIEQAKRRADETRRQAR